MFFFAFLSKLIFGFLRFFSQFTSESDSWHKTIHSYLDCFFTAVNPWQLIALFSWQQPVLNADPIIVKRYEGNRCQVIICSDHKHANLTSSSCHFFSSPFWYWVAVSQCHTKSKKYTSESIGFQRMWAFPKSPIYDINQAMMVCDDLCVYLHTNS